MTKVLTNSQGKIYINQAGKALVSETANIITATNNTGSAITAGDKVWVNKKNGNYSIKKIMTFETLDKYGSPIINNEYVASSFSESNYLTTKTIFNPVNNTWEIFTKITTGNNVTTSQGFLCGFDVFDRVVLGVNSGHFWCLLSSNNSSWNIMEYTSSENVATNTAYWIRLYFTGASYVFEYSTDGINFNTLKTVTSSTPIYGTNTPLTIGANRYNGGVNIPFLGSIDLSETYFNVNEKTIWVPYTSSITTNTLTGYAQENIASGSTGDVKTVLGA